MKLIDEATWTIAKQALMDDGDTGKSFCDVLVFWVETAEKLMDERPDDDPLEPIQAIRDAFLHVEASLGYIDMMFFGQLLLFISGIWVHGEQMVRGMTSLEKTPYMEAVREKIATNQAMAEQSMEQDS